MSNQISKISPVDVVRAYEDALNQYDIQGVVALLTEDVSFFIPSWGDMKITTRKEVQKAHEFLIGGNIRIHLTDFHVSDDQVTCKQSYIEDCGRSFGVKMIPGEAVFTISQDKIQKLKWDNTSDELAQFSVSWGKFTSWFQETYPNEWARITADDSWLTKETGTILSRRSKEYGSIHK